MSTWNPERPRRRSHAAAFAESFDVRKARLEHALLDELKYLLSEEARDPALEPVRVLRLELSGGVARVVYGVIEGGDDAESITRGALVRATGFLRSELATRLDVKRLPALSFAFIGRVEEER